MKRRTLTLLVVASAFYLLIVTVIRSIIPESATPTIPLLALPLILLTFVLVLDLRNRSTVSMRIKIHEYSGGVRARDMQALSRQIGVAGRSSLEYFDTILLGRLRDVLVEKVSLETGMERESVKKLLADRTLGPRLLKDQKTYALLYHTPQMSPGSRLRMLREIIERIEGWNA